MQKGTAQPRQRLDSQDSNDPYALTITGTAMVPRYLPGERVVADPRQVVEVGDFVAARIGARVLVLRLAARDRSSVMLQALNPPGVAAVAFARSRIRTLHKIVRAGEL